MRAGGQLSAGAGTTPTSAQTLNKMYNMQSTSNIANGVGQGVAVVGNMAMGIINYSAQMSALKSQEHMQDQAYDAAKEALEGASVLLDDVKDIHASKLELFGELAKAKKQQTVADARLFEAKKTQKSMKKANKAVLKKALGVRRGRFYGKAR